MNNNYFVRIVKMEFQEDKIDEFLTNFNSVKNKIRNQPGNRRQTPSGSE